MLRAAKSLLRLPAQQKERILRAVDGLRQNPFPRGTIKLEGRIPPTWRIRVGEYRVLYGVSQEREMVIIVSVDRRTSTTY